MHNESLLTDREAHVDFDLHIINVRVFKDLVCVLNDELSSLGANRSVRSLRIFLVEFLENRHVERQHSVDWLVVEHFPPNVFAPHHLLLLLNIRLHIVD